ncbi:DNA-3-methyladenine glycosylase family protein [Geminicoccus roseus]|uniref:DNA-3-methyladenine glycosylase family protein n=1 Tax=Geminicoccus roseus TaxID=404900 RepID=UPI001969BFAE|nr:DNA-3-methyladenine glycosylase 2 family protein [Geminicoccus roseus]
MARNRVDEEKIRRGMQELAARDPQVAALRARIGDPPPRIQPPGFATLLQIMTAQQISTKAAAAIWRRLEEAAGERPDHHWLAAQTVETLRACGMGRRKIDHARAMAAAVLDGALDLDGHDLASEAEIIAQIVAVPGFGRWSADIYLLFALGRVDVFPADDLAMQIAYQRLRGLEARPSAKALRAMVADWAPWRGVGALFLWHYYGATTLEAAG